MRFKDFLLEKNVYVSMAIATLIDRIKTKKLDVSDALNQLNHGNILYRGLSGKIGKDEFYTHTGYDEDEHRDAVSFMGGNFHAIIGALPSWSEINKVAPRTKAIICSSDKVKAIMHGKDSGGAYVILPENGTKLVISPSADIHKGNWEGISGFGDNTDKAGHNGTGIGIGVGSLIAAIFGKEAASMSKKSLNYIPSLKKITAPMIEKAIAEAETKGTKNAFSHYLNMIHLSDGANTLFDALNEHMSPKANGFKLQSIGGSFPHDREIWFNGRFAAIKMQHEPSKNLLEFCKALKIDVKHFIL